MAGEAPFPTKDPQPGKSPLHPLDSASVPRGHFTLLEGVLALVILAGALAWIMHSAYQTRFFKGIVTDETGAPIPGAEVSFYRVTLRTVSVVSGESDDTLICQGWTGSDGRFKLRRDPSPPTGRRLELCARRQGFDGSSRWIDEKAEDLRRVLRTDGGQL
ncbi:MAG: hypothetical protein AABZ85_08850, partial [Thermodesulfobacteriota bacterium]